jgi:hypothetical protein
MSDDAESGVFDRGDRLVVEDVRLRGEDFSGRQLPHGFVAVGARFEDCRFDGMKATRFSAGAGRGLCEYVGCSFDGVKFWMGAAGRSRFVGCSFERVWIRDWFCWAVEMVDCVFSGVLRKVIFDGRVPERFREWVGRDVNEYVGNDFSRADLRSVSFRGGVDLRRQCLPEGPEYTYLPDARAGLIRARRVVEGWVDPEAQREALILLRILDDEVAAGQEQMLLRASDFGKKSLAVHEALFGAAAGDPVFCSGPGPSVQG